MLVIYIYKLSNLLQVCSTLDAGVSDFLCSPRLLFSRKLPFLAAKMAGITSYAVAKTKPIWALVWPKACVFVLPVHEMEKPVLSLFPNS